MISQAAPVLLRNLRRRSRRSGDRSQYRPVGQDLRRPSGREWVNMNVSAGEIVGLLGPNGQVNHQFLHDRWTVRPNSGRVILRTLMSLIIRCTSVRGLAWVICRKRNPSSKDDSRTKYSGDFGDASIKQKPNDGTVAINCCTSLASSGSPTISPYPGVARRGV